MKRHLQFAEILAKAGPHFIQRPQMGKLLTKLSFQGIRVVRLIKQPKPNARRYIRNLGLQGLKVEGLAFGLIHTPMNVLIPF